MSNIVAAQGESRSSFLASPTIAALLIVAIAVATRVVAWWNPVAHVDDQFYLLAGEGLLKGDWPYIDIWDRKPLGLFLLYAGIAWIGGGSILALNLVATAFAAATAWVIRQIALRFASPAGATFGALSYLLLIPLVGGQTGQSPVFYNLLMAGAALLLIGAAETGRPTQYIVKRALGAMTLCGLAMTIKQISFIEGAYFGLAFLWLMHRRGIRPGRLLALAAVMILVALLPTALTFLAYALAGPAELSAYVDATVSIFLKRGWEARAKLAGLLYFIIFVSPLLIMAVAGVVIRKKRESGDQDRLLVGWIVASLAGYVAIPHFFDHYLLPVVVPLSVSASTLFDRQRLFFFALAAACLLQPPIRDISHSRRSQQEFDNIVQALERARRGGCIYIGDGPTRLYSVTGACRTTRFLFPDHLNLVIETDAVGVDTSAELARILAQRPAVIVTQARLEYRYSPAYRRFLARMKRDYRLVYDGPLDAPPLVQRVLVWQRRDLVGQ